MPGEVFVERGLELKKRSPFANTLVIELANEGIGYVPTLRGFAEGDYEAINSRLAPGGGEKMVEEALKMLNDIKNSNKLSTLTYKHVQLIKIFKSGTS